jgi:hypothetical protein
MDIDITSLFNDADPFEFSASRAERGANAGAETWRNAKEEAAGKPLLTTPDELDAMCAWAKETGAWEEDEIAQWSDVDVNALFIQLVAGDMREADLGPDMTAEDWRRYAKRSERGEVAGRIYGGPLLAAGNEGKIFYSLD